MQQKFGEISYEDYPTLTNEFVTLLKEDKIVASVCSECDEKYFPPRTACINFHSPESMKHIDVNREATLKAFTIIRFAPDSHSDKAPYVVAIGEMADGYNVLAHLVGVTSLPKIGMKMELKTQTVGNDRAFYKFVKA